MWPPLEAQDDLGQKLLEGDFPLAVDHQVNTQEGQCCSKESNDRKATAGLQTQNSSPGRSESGWTSFIG